MPADVPYILFSSLPVAPAASVAQLIVDTFPASYIILPCPPPSPTYGRCVQYMSIGTNSSDLSDARTGSSSSNDAAADIETRNHLHQDLRRAGPGPASATRMLGKGKEEEKGDSGSDTASPIVAARPTVTSRPLPQAVDRSDNFL